MCVYHYWRTRRCAHYATEKIFFCPKCVSFIYCSERCLDRNWKYIHHFECAVSDRLQHISCGHVAMGSKLFLYGLILFHNDFDEMMHCFATLEKTGGNALNVSYSKYDKMASPAVSPAIPAKPTSGAPKPGSFVKYLETAFGVFHDDNVSNTAKCNVLSQFIEGYAYLHTQKEYAGGAAVPDCNAPAHRRRGRDGTPGESPR